MIHRPRKKKSRINLSALLLTCDQVNPHHGRTDQKKKKKRNIERDYEKEKWRNSRGGAEKPPHATQAKRERDERKIKSFNLVVPGGSHGNNNRGNLSLYPLSSFLRAKIKKTTKKERKKKECCSEVSPLSFFLFVFFLPHITVNFPCRSPRFHNAVVLLFPRHPLTWRPPQQFKCNIQHMAEFMQRK